MAPLSPRRSNVAQRLDLIAAVWGGLIASIGLMAGSGRDWPARLTAAALSFGLGGFLAAYPEIETYVCTYSILQPSMDALAEALFGRIPFRGRLPVSLAHDP